MMCTFLFLLLLLLIFIPSSPIFPRGNWCLCNCSIIQELSTPDICHSSNNLLCRCTSVCVPLCPHGAADVSLHLCLMSAHRSSPRADVIRSVRLRAFGMMHCFCVEVVRITDGDINLYFSLCSFQLSSH